VGATPNNLLQDKLGEYRRVQLRVITGRGVYEMVGMPNVMMWYSPGGTWNIGKRDELGQNRGWYQAVSKAKTRQTMSIGIVKMRSIKKKELNVKQNTKSKEQSKKLSKKLTTNTSKREKRLRRSRQR
jgi:hypothetical protein